MIKRILVFVAAVTVLIVGGIFIFGRTPRARLAIEATEGPNPQIPEPEENLLPTVGVAKAVGWKAGERPTAAPGLQVAAFADGLDHPRWLYRLPNGDILVAETNTPPKPKDNGGIKGYVEKAIMKSAGSGSTRSANRITLLRDADGDGKIDTRSVFLTGLHSPFGMALVGDQLYVAETDRLTRFPYQAGATKITAPGTKVLDLPGGAINHHWTKNVVANPDGTLLYVSVGSNSNVGENGMKAEEGRAAIWEVNLRTGEHRIYAYGVRNPVGMGFEPTTKQLWAVANERDELGPDLVPDYLTSVTFGGFYGWPWSYWGGHVDKRPGDPPVESEPQYATRPDYAMGPHVAALGLSFATGQALGPRFADGAFVGEHGSWNRKPKSGYKVVFVPFAGGKPKGLPVDVLTGFLDDRDQARGRPVGVTFDAKGALLVADDVGGKVWRVTAATRTAAR